MSDTMPGCTYDKAKSRRGYVSLKAKDPHDGGEWDVLLPEKKMEWVKRQGKGATLELCHTVPWALRNIRRMFRGIRDDDHDVQDDGWLCYIATPLDAYDWKTGEKRTAWADEVFLVYVTDERVVYHWSWVKADPQFADLPVDHGDRFMKQVF